MCPQLTFFPSPWHITHFHVPVRSPIEALHPTITVFKLFMLHNFILPQCPSLVDPKHNVFLFYWVTTTLWNALLSIVYNDLVIFPSFRQSIGPQVSFNHICVEEKLTFLFATQNQFLISRVQWADSRRCMIFLEETFVCLSYTTTKQKR